MSHTWDVLLWHNDSIVRFDQSEGRILLTWTNERREWPSLVCSLQPPSLQWSAGWWCNPWQWRKVRRTTPEVKKYSSTSCSSLFSSISGPSYIISRYKDIWCLRWNSGHHSQMNSNMLWTTWRKNQFIHFCWNPESCLCCIFRFQGSYIYICKVLKLLNK